MKWGRKVKAYLEANRLTADEFNSRRREIWAMVNGSLDEETQRFVGELYDEYSRARDNRMRTAMDYARFLFGKIQRNRGFTDQTRQALLDVIETEHPDIHTSKAEEAHDALAIPEDYVHTTLEGYRRKEAEMRTLLEVEIPQNAADLGRAASFGDVSENAEYAAALEKQDLIMRRLRELRDALDRARILETDMVTTERVVIGTRVRLRNGRTGQEECFSILGPWDVDLEQGIISYLSPVGRGLLGRAPGDNATIDLPEGTVDYQVLSIDISPSIVAPAAGAAIVEPEEETETDL